MSMSAWGLFITPVLIASNPDITDGQREVDLAAYAQSMPASAELDLFDSIAAIEGASALSDSAMSSASGGASTAIDIGFLGANYAENDGTVSGLTFNNTTNGAVSNNIVSDNSGITTVFNNTGNGVVMQSIVNLNIFLGGGGVQP